MFYATFQSSSDNRSPPSITVQRLQTSDSFEENELRSMKTLELVLSHKKYYSQILEPPQLSEKTMASLDDPITAWEVMDEILHPVFWGRSRDSREDMLWTYRHRTVAYAEFFFRILKKKSTRLIRKFAAAKKVKKKN